MGVYDSQVALALRLIQEKGKAITLQQVNTIVPDDAKPWETSAETPDPIVMRAVFLNFNHQDVETHHRMGDTEIDAGDVKALVAADPAIAYVPSVGDNITDEETTYSIEWVQVLAPNGQKILFTLRLRK